MLKLIENQVFDAERSLYKLNDTELLNCSFSGPQDGESPLKHPMNVRMKDCSFSLRYPIWHADKFEIINCKFDELARAALWYCFDGLIEKSDLFGIKALRDCQNIFIRDSRINSAEFGWKCRGIKLDNCNLIAEYVFLDTQDLQLRKVHQSGKYSFQYCRDIVIEDSILDTKDAFWHSENILVRNSVLKGEYLGWFSTGLTLENCVIEGTQPLCFAENLTLKNCKMVKTDLAFEESSVNADIEGEIMSVKNPLSGTIIADSYGEIILDGEPKAKILTRG